MRLLRSEENDKFSLTPTLRGTEIPPYAILSHTWEADNQEVTFKDIVDNTWRGKAGHRKIQFCAEQARKHGLRYFWVDSCCIDKSSSAELAEAINCMFRWYRDAAKCYVYLSDVSTRKHSGCPELLWESAFRQSRWFTRGWTLQELLAPLEVDFFSQDCIWLGDKKSLELQIHETTSIPVEALHGGSLSQFRIEDRMLWAVKRRTTIEEDKAYSLLGVFDVHMPLIYGEGEKKAFRRLKEEIDRASGIDGSRMAYSCLR